MDEPIPFQTDPSGPIGVLKCCISPTGDILWPTKPFFAVAFGDSSRQYLNIIDKARGALQALYAEVFGNAESTRGNVVSKVPKTIQWELSQKSVPIKEATEPSAKKAKTKN